MRKNGSGNNIYIAITAVTSKITAVVASIHYYIYGMELPFLLQQVREFRIVGYALQFIRNNLLHLRFDAIIIFLYLLLHPVVSIFIGEVGNDGDFLVSGFLPLHLVGIHHNFGMEDFLLDTFGKVIRYGADKLLRRVCYPIRSRQTYPA